MAVREHSDSRSPVRPQLQSGRMPAIAEYALIRNQDVAEFPAKPHPPLEHAAFDNHAAAQPGADHRRNRSVGAVRAEDREVPPERSRVAVVQVADRPGEPRLQTGPDVVPGPVRVDEIRRSPRAQHAGGTGRPGRIEPNRHDLLERYAGHPGGDPQAFLDLGEANVRPLFGARRMLAKILDQKLLLRH